MEARAYARAGAMALLIDAPGMGDRGRGMPRVRDPEIARAFLIQCVTDIRRGLDLLGSRGADPGRLGYVGHSLGASVGGPLAGVEPRLAAVVLMAGIGDLSKRGWALRPDARYVRTLKPLDGTLLLAGSKASIFFQFATQDAFVSRGAAQRFIAAAPRSRRVEWYESDHRLSAGALRDRTAWLSERLGLAPVRGDSLKGGRLPRSDVAKYLAARPLHAMASWLARRRSA